MRWHIMERRPARPQGTASPAVSTESAQVMSARPALRSAKRYGTYHSEIGNTDEDEYEAYETRNN